MQLTGGQFTDTSAFYGNDLATFPDFPAEIRAPAGTLAGVSGFQLQFGSVEVHNPGDQFDALVAMNAAAFKTNIGMLKKGGVLILNTAGFSSKNLRLAGYEVDKSPLDHFPLDDFTSYQFDITKLTKECLKDHQLDGKQKDRAKNMFVLGFLYWLYNRPLENTIEFLKGKFKADVNLQEGNISALKAGYFFGDTTESFTTRYAVEQANLKPGLYRNAVGSQATALGLIAATELADLQLFFSSYPITPSSEVLHEVAKHRNFRVNTFQAEDEIAAIGAAIGASYGGALGVCSTSGPGMALKSEGIALAAMLEIPLVICDIQRAGPSTGLPTKTEQSDLLHALYGRPGECPMPVVAANSPSDCFAAAYEACRIAIEFMTPVIFLSDGYISNGAEPWRIPQVEDLPEISVPPKKQEAHNFQPYKRDDRLVRSWVSPGLEGLEHRIGGLEKEENSGAVSYDPQNHEQMVKVRQGKIEGIAKHCPEAENIGDQNAEILILGWGSTYGVIRSVVQELTAAHVHLRHLNPLPIGLKEIILSHQYVVIPELNTGHLAKIIQQQFGIQVHSFTKIQGIPITKSDLLDFCANLQNEGEND